MAVKQLDTPCWKPCAPGEEPGNDGMHWDAAERAAEYADPGDTVLPFPAPCWAVVCDGLPGQPCGEELEDADEGWIIHAENAAEADSQAQKFGWEISEVGAIQCPECIDEVLKSRTASHG